MAKKVVAIILTVVMALGLLTGCSLLRLDTDAVNGEIIAEIKPHTFQYKGDDGQDYEWTSPHVRLTRSELSDYFDANYAQYTQSMGLKEIMNMFATVMFNQRLLGVYAQYNIERAKVDSSVKMKDLTMKQTNDAWKAIYDSLDNRLYSEMKRIADSFGETAPVQPTKDASDAKETTYPVLSESTEDNSDEIVETEVWRPAPEKVGEDGLTSEQKMRLQATRNLLATLIEDAEKLAYRMTQEQKDLLKDDRAAYDEVKNLPLADERMLNLYGTFRDRFCVSFVYYTDAERSMKVANIQKMVEDGVDESVTQEELQQELRDYISDQLTSYNTKSAYTSALSSLQKPLLVRPYDVGQFYVKHILIPFSDEQKAKFSSTSTDPEVQGLSAAQLRERRDQMASEIVSYEHRDGEDYGNPLSIAAIRSDIQTTMSQAGSSPYARNQAFTKLIYKYNTDPGAFDNDLGYGLQRDEKSTYMAEFEKTAKDLYDVWEASSDNFDSRTYGGVMECVTDYGVHFMILSSVLPTDKETTADAYMARISLRDYYNVAQKETIGEYLTNTLIESRKTNAWSVYQNVLAGRLNQEFGDDIRKDEAALQRLIDDRLKELSQATA